LFKPWWKFDETSKLRPTGEKRNIYFGAAFLVTLMPIYVYYTIFDMSLESYGLIFAVVTLFSASILTFAYHNVAYNVEARLLKLRENVITRSSIQKEEGRDKPDLVTARKNEQQVITQWEAISFSIVYNNLLFLLSTVVLGCYIFGIAEAPVNYVLSISLSAALSTMISLYAL